MSGPLLIDQTTTIVVDQVTMFCFAGIVTGPIGKVYQSGHCNDLPNLVYVYAQPRSIPSTPRTNHSENGPCCTNAYNRPPRPVCANPKKHGDITQLFNFIVLVSIQFSLRVLFAQLWKEFQSMSLRCRNGGLVLCFEITIAKGMRSLGPGGTHHTTLLGPYRSSRKVNTNLEETICLCN